MAANPLPAPNLNPVSSAWAYIKGQCTAFVATVAPWIPAGLGNARDWLNNARAKGLKTTDVPTVGSVVVYSPGGNYDPANGHVAFVTAVANDLKTFTVREMNYSKGPGVEDTRVSNLANVQGFILGPGATALGNTAPLAPGVPGGVAGEIFGAAWSGLTAQVRAFLQAFFIFIGVVLAGIGLYLLLRAEGVKVPIPAPGPLKVLKGGKAA